MKQKELKAETEQLLSRYEKVLGDFRAIQIEMRKIRDEAQRIAEKDPILGSFAFLIASLKTDFLEKFNNLNFSKRMF